MTYIKKKSDIY